MERPLDSPVKKTMLRITLLNAAPDTGNLGVTALSYSMIGGLARRIPDLALTVMDYGKGIRQDTLSVDGGAFAYQRCGLRFSNNVLLPEAMWNIRWAARFGGAWNPIARHLIRQNFAVDITAGDSFTDLYGPKRFRNVNALKSKFLEWNIPLGLLPQTYGPFQDPGHHAIAVNIIRKSRFAWARDERSFGILRELLEGDFDPNRHLGGVDVAFLLDAVQPADVDATTMNWLTTDSRPTVGINVSGLIYNDPEAAVDRYKFVADYRRLILEFVRRLLERSDANVLFIPHVAVDMGLVESDISACQDVVKRLDNQFPGRLAVLPNYQDPRQAKWVISQCDWFCGTRMHATIAGLSTGVPTAAVAYSLKTAGVFEACEQGEHVADPRELATDAMIERLWQSWTLRQEARQSLAAALPRVLQRANRQMDEIAAACQGRQVAGSTGANPR